MYGVELPFAHRGLRFNGYLQDDSDSDGLIEGFMTLHSAALFTRLVGQHAYAYVCAYVCACIYIYIYVYICIER